MSRPNSPDAQRAVSPVIGVVLMVAITIVLAAAIGAFVFGLAPGSDTAAPIATLTVDEYDTGEVTIRHEGGDALDLDEHTFLVDGSEANEDMSGDLGSGQTKDLDLELEDPPEPEEIDVALRHDPTGDLVFSETVELH